MKREIPMLFSDDMVRALLADKKHQTRRLRFVGSPGDEIWVKECFAPCGGNGGAFWYRADGVRGPHDFGGKWRSSIFMPKAASRIWLRVLEVRIEQLQAITAEDALSEGVGETSFWRPKDVDENPKPTHEWVEPYWDDFYFWHHYPQRAFAALWDSINGAKASWASNPEVHVVRFEQIVVYGRRKGGGDADPSREAF